MTSATPDKSTPAAWSIRSSASVAAASPAERMASACVVARRMKVTVSLSVPTDCELCRSYRTPRSPRSLSSMTDRSPCSACSTCPGAWPCAQLSATRALYLGPEGSGGDVLGCSGKTATRQGGSASEAATRMPRQVETRGPSGRVGAPGLTPRSERASSGAERPAGPVKRDNRFRRTDDPREHPARTCRRALPRRKQACTRGPPALVRVVPSERLGQGHRRRSLMPRCESQARRFSIR